MVDLFVDSCPKTVQNFLKLCQIKYYNNCIFHYVQRDFLVQTGDPTKTGKGGESIHGLLYGPQARFFEDEIIPALKHREKGMVAMASPSENQNASQFYITTAENLVSLDEKHTIFGQVAEGWDVLEAINDMPCDGEGRPLQNIRIRHTVVLDDPTPGLQGLDDLIPEQSPEPEYSQDGRLEDDWNPEDAAVDTTKERIERHEEEEAKNRAALLEMIGDLPEADAAPPPNVLFVCKLNPITEEEDLEIIFSRFGKVKACDIIRDSKTGDSLCYGFIGFDSDAACEEAYFKMNNVLIDDRRIKVDFSQSVHHLWKEFKKHGRSGHAENMVSADRRDDGRLQLKEKHSQGYHVPKSYSRKRYDYVYADDDDHGRDDNPRHERRNKSRR